MPEQVLGGKGETHKICQGGNNFTQSDLAAGNSKNFGVETPLIMSTVAHPVPVSRSRIPVWR